MAKIELQKFEIDKFVRQEKAWTIAILLIIPSVLAGLFILSKWNDAIGPKTLVGCSIIGAILLVLLVWHLQWCFKVLPFGSITIDSDGLWYSHLGKGEGLIRWDSIHKIKTNYRGPRLEIYDSSDKIVLKAEHQLEGFETLKILINENATQREKATFEIDDAYVAEVKTSRALLLTMVLTFAAIPILAKLNIMKNGHWAVFVIVYMSIFSWRSICDLLNRPRILFAKVPFREVMIDDDGLWYSHLDKEAGLVAWDDICGVRDDLVQKRLVLLGSDGEELLGLEYQLTDFERLRSLVTEKLDAAKKPVVFCTVHERPFIWHFAFCSAMNLLVLFGCLLAYRSSVGNVNLIAQIIIYILLAVAFLGLLELYLASVWKLLLKKDCFEIQCAYRKKTIAYEDISAITHFSGCKESILPAIHLTTKDKKTIKLNCLEQSKTLIGKILAANCGLENKV